MFSRGHAGANGEASSAIAHPASISLPRFQSSAKRSAGRDFSRLKTHLLRDGGAPRPCRY
jgi:hypothetical protein